MSNAQKTPSRLVLTTAAAAVAYLATRGTPKIVETPDGPAVALSLACPRCGGAGRGYWRPDGGVCYACLGADTRDAVELVPVVDYARRERRRELAQARRDAKAAEKAAAYAAKAEAAAAKREAARAARAAESSHVGTVGKRSTFVVTVEKVIEWEQPRYSGYGYKKVRRYLMQDADGNRLTVKTTGLLEVPVASAYDDEIVWDGDRVEIKATVKEHNEYNGVAQTIIQRVKPLGRCK